MHARFITALLAPLAVAAPSPISASQSTTVEPAVPPTAAPQPPSYAPPAQETWEWTATNFTGGCSPAACTYHFSISAPAGPNNEPAFATTCEGNSLQNGGSFVPCTPLAARLPVAARLGESVYGPPTGFNMSVVVTVGFTRDVGAAAHAPVTYNYTGEGSAPYGRGSPGPQTFVVSPVNVTAVA